MTRGHRLDDFVRMRNRVFGRRERSDQRHGELRELNQTATAKASRLRRFRGDQVNAHEPDATGADLFGKCCSSAPNRATHRVELKLG
jgi:hypothetical protein